MTIIQLLFDENMNSPDFVEVFASEEHGDMALGKELIKAEEIVDEFVEQFAIEHRQA